MKLSNYCEYYYLRSSGRKFEEEFHRLLKLGQTVCSRAIMHLRSVSLYVSPRITLLRRSAERSKEEEGGERGATTNGNSSSCMVNGLS